MKNVKYVVRVNIQKFDEKGKMNSENFEYIFKEKKPLEARNKAIEKTKDLRTLFEDEMPEESHFSSFSEAELKEFKNYNSYSLELVFLSEENEWDNIIYGEEENKTESLLIEANYYMDNCDNCEFVEVEGEDGEFVYIMESHSQFLLDYNF